MSVLIFSLSQANYPVNNWILRMVFESQKERNIEQKEIDIGLKKLELEGYIEIDQVRSRKPLFLCRLTMKGLKLTH